LRCLDGSLAKRADMVKHTSLREFQRELAARLAEARAETAPHARLGVQAGAQLWLLRLDEAGEVLPLPEVTPVPLTQPWFLGLANVRGNLASVVDFAAFTGDPAQPRSPECRLVLLAERFGARSGLVVARMVGLLNINDLTAEDAGGGRPWIRAVYRDRQQQRWHEIDVGALAEHDDFLRVGI
jgi:twitching motility protein PilI